MPEYIIVYHSVLWYIIVYYRILWYVIVYSNLMVFDSAYVKAGADATIADFSGTTPATWLLIWG